MMIEERINRYKSYLREHMMLRMIQRKIVNKTRKIWIRIFCKLKINDRRVCFDNFEGIGYGGDSKYIYLELRKKNRDCEVIWFVRKKSSAFPKDIKQVYIDSVKAIYYQSTSKVWVDNTRTGHRTKKRKEQFYLQTWHANILAKKIEKDAEDKLWKSYLPAAKYDGSITDAFIVANKRYAKLARTSFWLNNKAEILKIGSPSNDILFISSNKESFLRLRNKINIDIDRYVILYAPSFRDDLSEDGYQMDFEKVIAAFEKLTSKKCIILVRFHPDVSSQAYIIEYNDSIINATKYPDVKELAILSDALITDYSSVAYDFLLLKKPIFRLCLDFKHYEELRGVYDEFYNMPYCLCYTNKDLIESISNFDQTDYTEALKKYFGINTIYDTGKASQKAANWIMDKLKR